MITADVLRRARALRQVRAERIRQDEKFGEQNRPSVAYERNTAEERCLMYGIPTEEEAKAVCEALLEPPEMLTFADIAIEEMSEVIAAPDDVERREELVQLAAVCVNWIECIDRRSERFEIVKDALDRALNSCSRIHRQW